MKNKSLKNNIENSSREKVTRFSIRKVSFGAASVAVSALFMALGQGSASAAETNTATEANVTNAATNNNTTAQDNKKEEVAAPVATTTVPTTPTTAEKAAEKINEKLATETNTAENKEQTTPKTQETSNTAAETTKPAEATAATTESNKPKSRKRRAVESDPAAATTTDEDNDSSINEKNLDVVNPYFEANGTPTTAEKWKVINSFDLIGWKLINPNQDKVVIANGKVTEYGGYASVVNPTHPYSIPLALYKKAGDRTSKSDKFDGIYQDIDVKPGQEVVITQNTGTFGPIGSRNNRTILTVSYPERGNDVQGKIIWRSLGTPYNGVVTVPKGVTKLRVRLEVDPDSDVAHSNNGRIEIDGETYYLGAMVSNLSITTGAHVVAKTPTVKYNEVSPSATATTVRATISVEMENKGHASSGSNKYQVKLPEGATFVSSEGGTAPGNVNNGTLTINYKGLKPGEKVTLNYTVDLPADRPTSSDFKGTNTFLTSTTYGGLSGTIQGGSSFAVVGAKLRNIPVNTQNVTVNMYKTDLENKVNELETKLAQLNESDYTPESWKAMKDQLATAKQILNEEQDNVPVADRKNQAEINAKLVLLEKEKAKLDLEKAAKDQLAVIDAVDGSVKEEKEAAKAKVIEALAAAKKAVDATTTEADVAAKLTEETNKITPILPAEEVKTAAKNDIQSILEEKKTQIAGRDDLTTEEKDAAVKEAERLAQEAKNRVDAATTEESVERNKDRGEEKVEKVDPAAKAKPAAKAAIDAALKAQEAAIDAKPDSTKEEKDAAKEEARAKAEEAKKAIDAAASNADVTTAKEAGVATITPVEPKAEVKSAAKQAIEDAYNDKVAEIEKRPELTTEEKEAAKAEARKLADAAKTNVDKAKTDAGVAVAEQQGTTKVADVDPTAKAKPAAKAAIDAALKAQEAAIDAKPESTKEEKEAAKAEARAKAEAAKTAIDAAASNGDVTTAQEAGVATITPVEPKAEVKPAAKQAIEDAYNDKVAEIEKRPELTTEEKEAAKAEARKLADAAKANVDKAKTDDAVATAEDKGTTKVDNVNPAAKAKPAAKAAIDAALKAQEKAIDAKPDSTIEEKEAAKEEARAKAEAAKAAIDAADSNADVTTAKEAGVATITPVEPKAEVKPAAKQAIEDAYNDKVAEIEKRPELTTEEKEAAKAEARKLADAAKANVDKAKTDDAVAIAEDKGTTKVADVDPAAKAKPAAKAAVDAALAEKEKAIDANNKLSDAEKTAAKEEAKKAADEAKKAIEAAKDQAGVDAKEAEGKAEIAKVLPTAATEAEKAAAKAEIEKAAKAKEQAIDANDKLTEAEKAAAKAKVAEEAKKAIEAIEKATTEAEVELAKEAGKAEIAKVTPATEVEKAAAKAEIEKAAKAKEEAIDANDKLTEAEKAAAKAKVAEEAKKAIEAIEKATTEAEVELAKEAGKAEIAKVIPATTDYKAKAKAEVEAELAKKLAELENATDLTEAEKAAAKAKVAEEAKKTIEAIEKATTEADVDQAIRNFVYRISSVVLEKEEYDLSKLFVKGSVTVKQGESLTDKDILSKLDLPEGVQVVKVEKPTTTALGTLIAKVTLKLADGTEVIITVPVSVVEVAKSGTTEKSSNSVSKKQLPNTGTTETNTGLAGLGLAMLTGLFAARRRKEENED